MFNLGFTELILLGAIALIFIGPKQLPDVAKTVGRLLNEWKRATSDLTSSFTDNDAFRDWEDRRQKYLEELKLENPGSHPDSDQNTEPVQSEHPEGHQMEMNLADGSEPKKDSES